MDSNHRPHAYQACALTSWAIGPNDFRQNGSPDRGFFRPLKTEQRMIEPSKDSIIFLRKEVIQPHLPIRLPCYDFTPIICPTLGGWLHKGYLTDFGCYKLSWCDGRCVQDPGTYSPRRADPRLLAIPASCRRVAACNPN